MRKQLLFTFFLCFIFNMKAQEQPLPILFIYDASGSMWEQLDGKTKKEIASSVLATTVGNLPQSQQIGLIAYGHRTKGDCNDIEYMVNLSNNSKTNITNAINSIKPIGKTPLARSATMAINSIKKSNTKATIILISDGIESCDGDICKVVTDAKANGIDFKLHIVGFGLKEGEKEQLICAAKAGHGNFYDANDTAGLGDVLIEATSQTVDKPDGNFSVYAVKNNQPVDAWVKVKDISSRKDIKGARTYRDTAWVFLPPGKHEIEIKPLENTDITATIITVEIAEGETIHKEISFDSGKISINTLNNQEGWDATVKVTLPGDKKIVTGGRTYGRTKELEVNPGIYDVFIQALVLNGTETSYTIKNVEVKPNNTTTLSHNFDSGIALIGVKTSSGELIDATVNFHEEATSKNVAAARTYTSDSSNPKKFLLNPGTYSVKVITLGKHKGNSETFTITVKTGETTEKIITF